MLLPLHDENPLRHIRFQYVTVAIIAVCVAISLYQFTLPPKEAQRFVFMYGAIPAAMFGHAQLPPELGAPPPFMTLITSMFLHGGLMHLAGNMLFLWVLGDNVEDAMGHVRYTIFYVLCGIAAALAHAGLEPTSKIPMIGASGAISGVIGAYLVLHPRQPIKTLVLRMIMYLPAYVVLGLWAAFQVFNAAMASAGQPGVAWWAHIGGFVAGVVLIFLFRKRDVVLLDRGYVAPRRRRSIIPDTDRR